MANWVRYPPFSLRIGNGVGKQGRGNQPPYRRYGPDTEIQYRPRKPHRLAKPNRILSKREADTEFQYRPHIVDTDINCGRRLCGRRFGDSYFLSVPPLLESMRSGGVITPPPPPRKGYLSDTAIPYENQANWVR